MATVKGQPLKTVALRPNSAVHCLPFHVVSTEYSTVTQSVSFVLLWQPSDYIPIILIWL